MKKKSLKGQESGMGTILPGNASEETNLSFVGKRAVLIENYRSILLYSEECIRIQAKHYELVICGAALFIDYYDKDEMKITGRFSSIAFQ